MTESEHPVRRRDASRTRADLLSAAAELFGQHGYAATTLRSIGERAGVDPAMIARYFGNKESLYLESVISSPPPIDPQGPLSLPALSRMVERAQAAGAAPVARVALVGSGDAAIRSAVDQIIRDLVTEPLRDDLERSGQSDAMLRSEVAAAIAFGVSTACASEVFVELATRSPSEVVDLCAAAIDAVLYSVTLESAADDS